MTTNLRYENPILFNQENLWDPNNQEPMVQVIDAILNEEDLDNTNITEQTEEELFQTCKDVISEILKEVPELENDLKGEVVYPLVCTSSFADYPLPFFAPENGKTITVVFNSMWNKSWGGELITYYKTKPKDVVSIMPGRIFMSEGSAWCRITQPNINATVPLTYLQFRLI